MQPTKAQPSAYQDLQDRVAILRALEQRELKLCLPEARELILCAPQETRHGLLAPRALAGAGKRRLGRLDRRGRCVWQAQRHRDTGVFPVLHVQRASSWPPPEQTTREEWPLGIQTEVAKLHLAPDEPSPDTFIQIL